jgi:hypothetical protein
MTKAVAFLHGAATTLADYAALTAPPPATDPGAKGTVGSSAAKPEEKP